MPAVAAGKILLGHRPQRPALEWKRSARFSVTWSKFLRMACVQSLNPSKPFDIWTPRCFSGSLDPKEPAIKVTAWKGRQTGAKRRPAVSAQKVRELMTSTGKISDFVHTLVSNGPPLD